MLKKSLFPKCSGILLFAFFALDASAFQSATTKPVDTPLMGKMPYEWCKSSLKNGVLEGKFGINSYHRSEDFRFASLSKTIVGLLFLRDKLDGFYNQSTTVGSYIGDKQIQDPLLNNAFSKVKDLRLSDLLTMTSQLAVGSDLNFKIDPKVKTGTYAYNNNGYSLLGLIWEQRHGKTLNAELSDRGFPSLRFAAGQFPVSKDLPVGAYSVTLEKSRFSGNIMGSCSDYALAVSQLATPLTAAIVKEEWKPRQYNYGLVLNQIGEGERFEFFNRGQLLTFPTSDRTASVNSFLKVIVQNGKSPDVYTGLAYGFKELDDVVESDPDLTRW